MLRTDFKAHPTTLPSLCHLNHHFIVAKSGKFKYRFKFLDSMAIDQKIAEYRQGPMMVQVMYQQFKAKDKHKQYGLSDHEVVEVRFFNGDLPIGFAEYLTGKLWTVNTGYFRQSKANDKDYRTGMMRTGEGFPRNLAQRLHFTIGGLEEKLVEDRDGELVTSDQVSHLPRLPVGERFQRGEYEFLIDIDPQNVTVQQIDQYGETKILRAGLYVDPKVIAGLIDSGNVLELKDKVPVSLTYSTQNMKFV